jgi:hypothetical protein
MKRQMNLRCLFGLVAFVLFAPAEIAYARLERPLVVISDLHFGPGKKAKSSEWHAFEDFRWSAALKQFLDHIESLGSPDLVLAGDTFELWQGDDHLCPALKQDANLGCGENELEERLRRVIREHKSDLELLGKYTAGSSKHVWLIPGNHDAGLLFDAAAQQVKEAIGGSGVEVSTSGYWQSADGLVYVEHGHMIGHDPNRMEGWPAPFITAQKVRHLRRPWGEQFVVRYYNDWERRYPSIDNLTESFAGAKLAMAAEGSLASILATRDLIRFFFTDVSWPQFTGGLGGDGGPCGKAEETKPIEWDLAGLRKMNIKDLAKLLPPEDPMRGVLQTTGKQKVELTDEELMLVCDRAQVTAALAHRCDPVCATKGLGGINDSLFRRRNDLLAAHLRTVIAGLPDGKIRPRFQAFVYGHTHDSLAPFTLQVDGTWSPTVVNTGAFQRRITPAQVAKRFAVGTRDGARAALSVPLDQLPDCYDFVLIQPGEERSPRLLHFIPGQAVGKSEVGGCRDLLWQMDGGATREH